MCLTPNARHIGTINVWFFFLIITTNASRSTIYCYSCRTIIPTTHKKNICIYGLKLRQIWNLDTNNKKQQQQAKKHHKLKNINSFCSFKDKMFTCFGVYISTLYEWSFMNDNWTKKNDKSKQNTATNIQNATKYLCEVCLSGLYHGSVNM